MAGDQTGLLPPWPDRADWRAGEGVCQGPGKKRGQQVQGAGKGEEGSGSRPIEYVFSVSLMITESSSSVPTMSHSVWMAQMVSCNTQNV